MRSLRWLPQLCLVAGCSRGDVRPDPADRVAPIDVSAAKQAKASWEAGREKGLEASLLRISVASCANGHPFDSQPARLVIATTGSVVRIDFTPEAGGFDHGCLRKAVLGQLVTEPYNGASRVARVEVTRADMRRDVADPYANMSAQHRIVMIGESTSLAE